MRTWNKKENLPSRIYDKDGFAQLPVEGDRRIYVYKKFKGKWKRVHEHVEAVYN
jgi:hypothetical protein